MKTHSHILRHDTQAVNGWPFYFHSSQFVSPLFCQKQLKFILICLLKRGKPRMWVSPPNGKPSSYLSGGLHRSVGLHDSWRPQRRSSKIELILFVGWFVDRKSLVKPWRKTGWIEGRVSYFLGGWSASFDIFNYETRPIRLRFKTRKTHLRVMKLGQIFSYFYL